MISVDCLDMDGLLTAHISLYLQWDFWYGTPYLIFGIAAVVAGALSFVLPESVNQVLPETIEDGEMFGT